MNPTVFDVAVVGAGPAGAATARRLALAGRRVVLIERSRFDAPRVGESLAPNVQPLLRELGVWPGFLALSPRPSWGTRSVWGEAEERAHSHVFHPFSCGWHVDRRAFDHLLADAAVAAGAVLLAGETVRDAAFCDGQWYLPAQQLCARVLVDATGRSAKLARHLGAKRLLFDRLVGVATHWTGVAETERGHLLVESAPDGWWYSAPLPEDGAMVTMLMTDADLCATRRLHDIDRWMAAMRQAPSTWQRLAGARRTLPPQAWNAHSQRMLRPGGGDGPWLAVGDAALAVDPVSGSGVLRALRTAKAAAEAVEATLRRPADAGAVMAAYEADRDDECSAYLPERAQYYAAEPRFDSPFWRRRHLAGFRPPGTPGRVPSATSP